MKRSALLIGLNKERNFLLHHKTADAPTNADLWVLMGGSIEQGEEPEDAMVREIKEELDILIHPVLFKTYTHEEKWGMIERSIFYAPVEQPLNELKSAQQEGDDLGFFSPEEMKNLHMNENHFRIIHEFLASSMFNQFLARRGKIS